MSSPDHRKQVLGVLGGGQLGRMMIEAANRLNVKVCVLDQPGNAAVQIHDNKTPGHVDGSFRDAAKIKELAAKCDILTVEIEHVDVSALEQVERETKIPVRPSTATLRTIQDKYAQKVHLAAAGIPLPDFAELDPTNPVESLLKIAESGTPVFPTKFGFPIMLKTKTMAYDGRGNRVVKSADEAAEAVAQLSNGSTQVGLYVERWVPFEREIAVMVARGLDGQLASYPCVETVQKDNICHVVVAPAQIDGALGDRAVKVAENAIASFPGAGIYGVEMFLLKDGSILLNEIAPRPHNSGHYATEACDTSQFEQHLRAVMGLPLGSTRMKVPAAVMVNILGRAPATAEERADPQLTLARVCNASIATPGATLHMYGKGESRPGRKMGHVTLVGQSVPEVFKATHKILESLEAPSSITSYTPSAALQLAMTPRPVVGIIMGSDSDLPTMRACAEILRQFEVPFECTLVSAHRTPDRLVTYARTARSRGLQVIVAAAGGAAHLPGMVAAMTPLPVIGCPVALKQLDGVDSLYSIVQMPRGVPVATVAINNSTNAALLAIRILGSSCPSYLDKLENYRQKSEAEVMAKVAQMAEKGWDKY